MPKKSRSDIPESTLNQIHNPINRIDVFTVGSKYFNSLDGMGFSSCSPGVDLSDSFSDQLGIPRPKKNCILISEKFLFGALDGNQEFFEFIIHISTIKLDLLENLGANGISSVNHIDKFIFTKLLEIFTKDKLYNFVDVHKNYTLERYNDFLIKMHTNNDPKINDLQKTIAKINSLFEGQLFTLKNIKEPNRN